MDFLRGSHTGHGTITGVVGHKMRQMRHETHIFEVSHLLMVFNEQIPHLSQKKRLNNEPLLVGSYNVTFSSN